MRYIIVFDVEGEKEMNSELSKRELFETVPVKKAVATLAVPTIISQIVTIIYNLADTFFVGQLNNPYMVAAVTVVSPWFNLLTALGNLFGIGGSSLISRLLGAKRDNEVKYVSSLSIYSGIIITFIFSLLSLLFQGPLLIVLGASSNNIQYAQSYLFWTVILGGIPTTLAMTMAHLLRGEGKAKFASIGMMLGEILNIILDPLFIFGLGLGFLGAAIATATSNLVSTLFFIYIFYRVKKQTTMSLNISYFNTSYLKPVLSVGIASALTTLLANVSNMVIISLASGYGDIPVAAYGIVKRIDMFPLNISFGLCQGIMPLVGYNYASKNYQRMKEISSFSWKVSLSIAFFFLICFTSLASFILPAFIEDPQTSQLGAEFLRIACLAVPFTAINALIIYTLQAMGKGVESAILTVCRQGLLNIPILFIMNHFVGLYGMIWVQLVIELIVLPIVIIMYRRVLKQIKV